MIARQLLLALTDSTFSLFVLPLMMTWTITLC